MTEKKYRYYISGYYFAGGEKKHFGEELMAVDNIEAMQKVLGMLAWKESIEGNSFMLDTIHYDVI